MKKDTYDWPRIMTNKSETELLEIINERNPYPKEKREYAVNELKNRNLMTPQMLELIEAGQNINSSIVETGEDKKNKKDRANRDMLFGALWCIGGIVATVSDLGYIFWGAIVFGAIQFIRGAINS